MNFFRVVKWHPQAFKDTWRCCLVSREEFYQLRDTNPNTIDPIQRAYRFFYLNRCSYGGDMARRPRFGVSARDPNLLTPLLDDLDEWVGALHERLQNAWIENMEGPALIERLDRQVGGKLGTVYFCDPPYLGTYGYETGTMGEDGHRKLSETLSGINGKFLLTINDHPAIRSLYAGCYIQERTKQYSIGKSDESRREYGELIISNYPLLAQKQATLFDQAPEDEPAD